MAKFIEVSHAGKTNRTTLAKEWSWLATEGAAQRIARLQPGEETTVGGNYAIRSLDCAHCDGTGRCGDDIVCEGCEGEGVIAFCASCDDVTTADEAYCHSCKTNHECADYDAHRRAHSAARLG